MILDLSGQSGTAIRRPESGCGNDVPVPCRRYHGRIFVHHTSDDTRRIVSEALVRIAISR